MKKSTFACRGVVAVTSTLLAVAIGVTAGATSYRSLICSAIGGDMYRIVDEDGAEVTQLYQDNGMTLDEWKAEADSLVQQVAEEGVVLLKNQDQVLPLAEGSRVSLFGRSSVDLVLSGSGGGGVIDSSSAVDLKTALEEDAGFSVNGTLWDFYASYTGKDGYTRSSGGLMGMGATADSIFVAEVPQADYPAEVTASYSDYNDAAIVVISRVGGEGNDMPTGAFGDGTKYLALQDTEKELLQAIQASGQFDKVIALINSSNAMELGWVDQQEYGIDACLWIGSVGQSGIRSVARVLSGQVNPSGRLVDTYAADSFSAPAMQNFGDYTFANADEINTQIGESNNGTKYVVYREGIYVGYRYYETRYADSVLDPVGSNALSAAGAYVGDTWNYTDEVCYPFGYGLSYGSADGQPFQQEIVGAGMNGDTLEMTVRVTNTGTMAGKCVVQLYAQQPYVKGALEKSAVQLIGFDKTEVLQPGASAEVVLTADKDDFSTYDYKDAKTWVLDAGTYYFAVGNSAHDALNNILAAQGKTVADGMNAEGNAALAFAWENPSTELRSESFSGSTITNQFDNASLEYYGSETGYLTRSDWNTFPESYTDLTATPEMIADIDAEGSYQPGSTDVSAITTGADNQMTIAKMIGLAFDDPSWDKLLDQLTVDDMVRIVTGSALSPIPSIVYPQMYMKDGPQGNTQRPYVEDGSSATGYCGEVVRASTFNRELERRVGEAMGEDWLRTDTEGAYTPGANIHRTPYSGRNFEYFSEDGFLTGELAKEEVLGMQEKGIICYIKHFMMNDQETNRQGLCTFSNEQAIREIYLKAFEAPFTEGGSKGSMGAFNRIGCTWAGAHSGLAKNVVRDEWGSTAILDTDIAINTTFQNVMAGLEAGNTLWATSGTQFYQYSIGPAMQDAKMLQNLRDACHVILYNIADSIGVNGLSPTAHVVSATPYWETLAYALCVVLAVVDLAAFALLVKGIRSKPQKEE